MQLFISFAARISPLKIREVSGLTSEIGVLPEYKNRSEEELESLEDINVTRDKMLVEAQLKQVSQWVKTRNIVHLSKKLNFYSELALVL